MGGPPAPRARKSWNSGAIVLRAIHRPKESSRVFDIIVIDRRADGMSGAQNENMGTQKRRPMAFAPPTQIVFWQRLGSPGGARGARGTKSRAFPPGGPSRSAGFSGSLGSSGVARPVRSIRPAQDLRPDSTLPATQARLAVAAFCSQRFRGFCFNRLMSFDSHCGGARSS